MPTEVEVAALSRDALIVLVHQLRHEVAEREREIARLKHLLAASPAPAALEDAGDRPSPPQPPKPLPGTQEDLLAQLEKLYPAGG